MKSVNIIFLFVIVLLCACGRKKTEIVWVKALPVTGSQSSPRASDLNQDGVLDIVMGAGKNEYQESKQGIIALDGKTGELLWEHEAKDQVYGSATFYDVTNDGISDVFIGGRSPYFKALNGKTGTLIWQYKYRYENDSILKHARFNFNNSLLVPDENGDGLLDLVTVNGGNSKALPNSEKNRFPGVMILFDSKTGGILAADTMPDGKETYLSPAGFLDPETNEYQIIFGTGGETIDGHLYLASLSKLTSRRLADSKILASEKGHGFIAPPSLADITGDGYYDIVSISHGSTVFAIDGRALSILWKTRIPNTESSNSLAVGQFTDDRTPDFFTFISKGEWPNNTGSLQILLNGKNGNIEYMDSLGCTGFSSPVAYDLNDDGWHDSIISINEFNCNEGFTANAITEIQNRLVSIDFRNKRVQTIEQLKGFKNIFSTPWIGDLDRDGYLDIVYCQYFSRGGLLAFLGMQVKRISTSIKVDKKVPWGSYMGTYADGTFRSLE